VPPVSEPILPDAASRILAILAQPESPQDLPRVPGYTVVAHLGVGGGGEVYRGFREGSDRPVAIKLLKRARSPEQQGRAWRELELLSQLRLPAVPAVFDYGLCGRQLYIVSHFVDGQMLDEHTEKLPLRQCVELLCRVTEAVQSVNERGIIHRDLKPSNVLVDSAGQPVIIDFGIATLLASDVFETLTHEGTPVGTPAFMAPEQARGERHRISTRTDVYGLAATAYAILTRQPPHDTSTTLHEAVRRVAQDPPRNPRELDASLPKPLAAVLFKGVSQAPEDRYASAGDFGADLRRWLRGEPVLASGGSRWLRTARWALRHPLAATTALCLFIMASTLAATGLSLWYLNIRPDRVVVDTHDRSWARLLTVTGRPVRSWDTEQPEGIAGAVVLERGAEYGGGKLVAVAFGPEVSRSSNIERQWAGKMCVFDAAHPREHLWTSHVQLPVQLRYATPVPPEKDEFRPRLLAAEDIFPEAQSPGKELVLVSWNRPYSPACVQVYSQDGRTLFEAWHDGQISSIHWMHTERVLVLAGCDSDGTWVDRGYRVEANYPRIVFAIRPRVGEVGTVYAPEGRRGARPPLWYVALLPAQLDSTLEGAIALGSPYLGLDGGSHVRVSILGANTTRPTGLSWVLDKNGAVKETVIDAGWSDQGLPSPDRFVFGKPPPRSPWRMLEAWVRKPARQGITEPPEPNGN
jgi:hypothetical protein